uniref:Uncharacterized protein n=1 Tax=Aegilops tauschii subsp. strangulata TaxID=200361 RepID=A0A453L835_AEGTS
MSRTSCGSLFGLSLLVCRPHQSSLLGLSLEVELLLLCGFLTSHQWSWCPAGSTGSRIWRQMRMCSPRPAWSANEHRAGEDGRRHQAEEEVPSVWSLAKIFVPSFDSCSH